MSLFQNLYTLFDEILLMNTFELIAETHVRFWEEEKIVLYNG